MAAMAMSYASECDQHSVITALGVDPHLVRRDHRYDVSRSD
jgi:hypothetical protein